MARRQILFLFLLFVMPGMISAQPVIESWSGPDTIACYDIAEFTLDLTATYNNPYSADEVVLAGSFIAPNGDTIVVDGFYMIPYTMVSPDTLSSPGNPEWRIRFAPRQEGVYSFSFSLSDQTGSFLSATDSLFVSSPESNGFLSFEDNYLRTDAGDLFFGVGENMGWVADYTYSDFEKWTDSLVANHCNFVRVWFSVYTFQIEWNNAGPVGSYDGRMNRAWWFDWFLEMTREKGIKVQLCINETQAYVVTGFPSWNYNPYSTIRGGPCEYPWEFFSNEDARYFFKRKLRYMVARWAAYDNLLAWELFNEVDGVDGYSSHVSEINNWHSEMSLYLHNIDRYTHPVTTSLTSVNKNPNIWYLPEMDFLQEHLYYSHKNIDYEIYQGTRDMLQDYEKPACVGEFNLHTGHQGNIDDDPTGIHMHNSMWASLFSGSFSSSLPWYWKYYIHNLNLYHQLKGPATFAKTMRNLDDKEPVLPQTTTAEKEDLVIEPGFITAFFQTPENYFTVGRNGIMIPHRRNLASMLYGYGFNNYRSPPHFIVDYNGPGTFSVTTGSIEFFSKIRISIDATMYLEQNASVNTTYTVNVPAGQHTILCENVGNGYVDIQNYEFGNYQSLFRCYALKSDTSAFGWAHHIHYNHEDVNENGPPVTIPLGSIDMGTFPSGYYYLNNYSGEDGVFLNRELITHNGGNLTLEVQNLQYDRAFYLSDPPETVSASISASDSVICLNEGIFFSDTTQGIYTQRKWIFDGGSPSTSSNENIYVSYLTPGVFDVTLIHNNAFMSDTVVYEDYVSVFAPPSPIDSISGPSQVCSNSSDVLYEVPADTLVSFYEWNDGENQWITLVPFTSLDFFSSAITTLSVKAFNECGAFSQGEKTIYAKNPIVFAGLINGPEDVYHSQSEIPFYSSIIPNAVNYVWNFPSGIHLSSNTAKNIVIAADNSAQSGVLSCRGENACGLGPKTEKVINVTELPVGWNPLFYGDKHRIKLLDGIVVTLDGNPLSGDFSVGVFFDDNDELKCGGAMPQSFFSEEDFFLYGDDIATIEKDGFLPGDTLRWMLYSENHHHTFAAEAEYFFSPEVFTTGGTSYVLEIHAFSDVHDQILIPEGWSGLSSYIVPGDTLVENLFSDVDEHLVILKSADGLVYWPPYANTIEYWYPGKGYKIKMDQQAMKSFEGIINLNKTIAVHEGWNEIPVIAANNVDAFSLFNPLLDTLLIAKESVGNGVFWPAAGVYTLEYLKPGNSYMIYSYHNTDITFPADTLWPGGFDNAQQKIIPFVPPSSVSHMFVFSEKAEKMMAQKDVIRAVSQKGISCGYAVINKEGRSSIAVYGGSMDLPYPSEKVYFSFNDEDIAYLPLVRNSYEGWKPNGYSIIDGFTEASLSHIEKIPSIHDILVSPNPASEFVTFSVPKGLLYDYSEKEIRIFSSKGELVHCIKLKNTTSSYQWNVQNIHPGIYHYHIKNTLQKGKIVVL